MVNLNIQAQQLTSISLQRSEMSMDPRAHSMGSLRQERNRKGKLSVVETLYAPPPGHRQGVLCDFKLELANPKYGLTVDSVRGTI